MSATIHTIRQKLHQYIDTAEERKVQAMYVMLEEEIECEEDYTDEFKNELDKRLAKYKLDGVVIEESQANERINNLMQKLNNA